MENPNPLLNERLLLVAYAAKTKPGEPVFKIGRQWFWVLVKRHAKGAGIPARQARTHSFRHTVAMNFVDKIGVPKLQRFLGQRSEGAVLRYTKPKEGRRSAGSCTRSARLFLLWATTTLFDSKWPLPIWSRAFHNPPESNDGN